MLGYEFKLNLNLKKGWASLGIVSQVVVVDAKTIIITYQSLLCEVQKFRALQSYQESYLPNGITQFGKGFHLQELR